MEGIISKYVETYVTCSSCKGMDTRIIRDPVSRLQFIECNKCTSRRSVAAIKAGYHATTKSDRKNARETD